MAIVLNLAWPGVAPEAYDEVLEYTFFKERLTPALQQIGVEGEPKVELAQVHRYFDTAVARGAANS
jgi:hypothetical protein